MKIRSKNLEFTDASYKSFFSPSELSTVSELGQPVYVEVFAVKHQDKELTLLLEDCWATPTQNPSDPQKWNLLIKGCSSNKQKKTRKVIVVQV